MRAGFALFGIIVVWAAAASAQPAQPASPGDNGYIGRELQRLEIDDCRQPDPAANQDQLRARASEHYQRGETLYVQGDYVGAVSELVTAYCTLPYFTILKDIGQAYERSLEYEKAIGYLERYVAQVPADAKRSSQCAADPQEDKHNVERRISVLQALRGHVYVETSPPGAHVTIRSATGSQAQASSGNELDLLGGRYEMRVERDGYEPFTQTIEVRIGKPYTYFVPLVPLRGKVSILTTPPDARIFLNDRMVGFGRYEETLPGGAYTLGVEAADHLRSEKRIEVLPNQTHRELVELEPVPQTGRRQLIIAAGLGGATVTGALLGAFQNTSIVGAGSVLGGAAGLVGAYFQLPRDLSLGTSNLTITASLTGALGGSFAAAMFTRKQSLIQPIGGASALVGAVLGYSLGERLRVRPGDAALFNSAVLWGTTAGALFSVSFAPPREVGAGLVLTGIGVGGLSGVLLTNYFSISRTHAVLIDIGGLIGMAGGLAIESLAYPQKTTSEAEAGRNTEHLANFALGGMIVGLVGAGVLTRNLDVPTVPVRPTVGTVTGADGKATTTYGVGGTF